MTPMLDNFKDMTVSLYCNEFQIHGNFLDGALHSIHFGQRFTVKTVARTLFTKVCLGARKGAFCNLIGLQL